MKKSLLINHLLVLVLASIGLSSWAEIPSGYYNSLEGKVTSDLKTATCNLVYPHTMLTYNSLWGYFRSTDVHFYPDQDKWWDMYSGLTFYVRNGSSGMNREHSFPKSWWGGTTTVPAYTDLNHLYPAETQANLAKNNYPLGEVSQTTFDNGWTKVGYPVSGQGGGSTQVFEPADEYKGDFARTYFYMVTTYQNLTWKYAYMLIQGTYPTLKPWAIDLLLKWHRADPVSQKEIDRNEAVYRSQNNRNPFIDYPDLAEYIWGNQMGSAFYPGSDTPTGDPAITSPVKGSSLDFGETAVNKSQTLYLHVKGENLTGNITVTVYGTDASLFKSALETIPAANINSTTGYQLAITYSPTSIGNHTAKVNLSDGGIQGSYSFSLIGQALATPTLHTLTATEASDITSTSYTANWNIPADDVVDYYVVTRTIYENSGAVTHTYVAEENSYTFDDLTPGTTQSYYVQSSRLGYLSAPSNTIQVSYNSVTGIDAAKGLAIMNLDGAVRFTCDDVHTNCEIYNMQGQLIKIIPVIENGMILPLPTGVYIIRTTEMPTPLKITISAH